MNIFLREMKAHRKSLIIWCIGILLLIAAGIGKYTGYSNAGQSMNELVAQLPQSVRAIMGISSFDITKISGFYGVFYLYLVIMASIHSTTLGATIISREERDKTAEFLYSRPATRNRIITAKLSAAFLNVVIFNIVTLTASIMMVGKYSKGENMTVDILKLMFGMFMLQMLFLVIGSGISALSGRPKTSASKASGIMLATFLLSIMIDVDKRLSILKYFTPFKYFESKHLMYGKSFEPVFIALTVLIFIAMIILTYTFYRKRDLKNL